MNPVLSHYTHAGLSRGTDPHLSDGRPAGPEDWPACVCVHACACACMRVRVRVRVRVHLRARALVCVRVRGLLIMRVCVYISYVQRPCVYPLVFAFNLHLIEITK